MRATRQAPAALSRVERHGELQLTVRLPTTTYFDEFLRLSCREELSENQLFPNAKELTESFAAARAALFETGVQRTSRSVNAVVVGDGATPRTAATLALRSHWRVLSVDPALRVDVEAGWRFPITRLSVHRCRIQSLDEDLRGACVVVAVHAHVRLADAITAIEACGGDVVAAVALACCGWEHDAPGLRAVSDRDDWGIWSPERRLQVWAR